MLRWLFLASALSVACDSQSGAAPALDSDAGGRSDSGSEPAVPEAGDVAARDATDGPIRADAGCGDNPELAPGGAVCIETVGGRLIELDGSPARADLLVSACGPQQCNPGETTATGRFEIAVNLHLRPADYSVLPHTRPEHAGFYYPLPAGSLGPEIELGDLRLLRMTAEGAPLIVDRKGAAAQSVVSGAVTLEIPEGVYVRLDVENNALGEPGRQFKALPVPAELQDDFIDPELGAVAVYAFEPFEARFELVDPDKTLVDVRLSFDNTQGLAAGSAVELLALGSYLYPDWVAPAHFLPVAKGHVTTDGERIELDPGEGLRYLTWVAIRPKGD